MPKKFIMLSFFLCFAAAGVARADSDFYGVKMPSESCAKGVVIGDAATAGDFFGDEEGVDKSVYAVARIDWTWGSSRDIAITVFNNTSQPILTPYNFTDYTVVTVDGQRLKMGAPAQLWHPVTDAIGPKSQATFKPSLSGWEIKKEDIQYIICSFDLGETKIVLLPLPAKKAAVLPAPVPVPAPSPAPARTPSPSPAAAKPAPAPWETAEAKPAVKKEPEKKQTSWFPWWKPAPTAWKTAEIQKEAKKKEPKTNFVPARAQLKTAVSAPKKTEARKPVKPLPPAPANARKPAPAPAPGEEMPWLLKEETPSKQNWSPARPGRAGPKTNFRPLTREEREESQISAAQDNSL